MKQIIIVVIIIAAGLILYYLRNRSIQSKTEKITTETNKYNGLRQQVFSGTRAIFNIPENDSNSVWCVVVEFIVSDATVTIVSLADGNASIYLSSGGGFIGGFGHSTIKSAAIKTVNLSLQFKRKMQKVDAYPLPTNNNVVFYLLTDDGIYSVSDSEDKVTEQKSEFSPLFFAAQDVITQYRLIQK